MRRRVVAILWREWHHGKGLAKDGRAKREYTGRFVIRFGKDWKKPFGVSREYISIRPRATVYFRETSYGECKITGVLAFQDGQFFVLFDGSKKLLRGGEKFEIEA